MTSLHAAIIHRRAPPIPAPDVYDDEHEKYGQEDLDQGFVWDSHGRMVAHLGAN